MSSISRQIGEGNARPPVETGRIRAQLAEIFRVDELMPWQGQDQNEQDNPYGEPSIEHVASVSSLLSAWKSAQASQKWFLSVYSLRASFSTCEATSCRRFTREPGLYASRPAENDLEAA